MKNNRFWNWVRNEETGASEMYLYGAIAESTRLTALPLLRLLWWRWLEKKP